MKSSMDMIMDNQTFWVFESKSIFYGRCFTICKTKVLIFA